jgi:hypothetical protein
VLEAGENDLVREGGGFVVHYHEHEAPDAPRSLDDLQGISGIGAKKLEAYGEEVLRVANS